MKKTLVCNQKMYLTYDEAVLIEKEMKVLDDKDINLIICPSYLNFNIFKDYELCSQDAFYEDKGAYTGCISAFDLSLRGIKYSLVGHSERRLYDTDEVINLKVKALLKNMITPILCIGETKNDRELRKTSQVLKKQLEKAFKDIKLEDDMKVIIAYEPRYLIGGKNTLLKEEIEDIMVYIKKVLDNMGINNYKLLYGGSVHDKNIESIKSDNFDGYLLGAASIDINEIVNIIKCIK